MKTLRFKTNINCINCKAKVANILNNEKAIASWEVDTNNLEKILTVHGENIDEQLILASVAKVGFKAISVL